MILVSRSNSSGTYAYFQKAVLKGQKFKQNTIDQAGSKDVVSLVEKTKSAIGYSGMGYATPGVKMLDVARTEGGEAFAPLKSNAASGKYPIARPLMLYTAGEPTGPLKEYIEWIKSPEGQAIVDKNDYVGVPPTGKHTGPGTTEEVSIKVSGSDTMVDLAGAWAEAYNNKYPNIRVSVSGGGSGFGIADLMAGKAEIANASRTMKEGETAEMKEKTNRDAVKHVVGMDALAVYVHPDNPLKSISLEKLAKIFGEDGDIENWTQLEVDFSK